MSYDLKEGQDYGPIIDALKNLNAVRALESFWLVELTDSEPLPVLNYLKTFLPTAEKDKLMVIQFVKRPRFTLAFKPAAEWIQERFP